MGYVYDSKCVLLIFLRILWEETDEDHILSYEEVGDRVFEIYEPKRKISSRESKVRFVRKHIMDLQDYFSYTKLYEPDTYTPEIVTTWIVNGNERKRAVFLKNRILGQGEVSLLSDAILFSKGIDRQMTKELQEKVQRLGNRYYSGAIRWVRKLGAVEHTANPEIFRNIDTIVEAIKKKQNISFLYKNQERMKICPYCMAGELGYYYVLGGFMDSDKVYHFRLDRMQEMQIEGSKSALEIGKGSMIDWELYFRQHPRMSYGEVIRVTLLSRMDISESIKSEFYIESLETYPCGRQKITVSSTKAALCNWIVNLPEEVKVVDDFGSGVMEELCGRAKKILQIYGGMKFN